MRDCWISEQREMSPPLIQADILSMVNNRLSLLVEDDYLSGQFGEVAQKLEKLLPGMNVSAFVADFPLVLDVDDFERAVEVGWNETVVSR